LPETETTRVFNNRPEKKLLLITQTKFELKFLKSASVWQPNQQNQQTAKTLQPLPKFGKVHFLSLYEGEIIIMLCFAILF
jgi:hypothetical protein